MRSKLLNVITRIVIVAALVFFSYRAGHSSGLLEGFDYGYVTGAVDVLSDPETALTELIRIKKERGW